MISTSSAWRNCPLNSAVSNSVISSSLARIDSISTVVTAFPLNRLPNRFVPARQSYRNTPGTHQSSTASHFLLHNRERLTGGLADLGWPEHPHTDHGLRIDSD